MKNPDDYPFDKPSGCCFCRGCGMEYRTQGHKAGCHVGEAEAVIEMENDLSAFFGSYYRNEGTVKRCAEKLITNGWRK